MSPEKLPCTLKYHGKCHLISSGRSQQTAQINNNTFLPSTAFIVSTPVTSTTVLNEKMTAQAAGGDKLSGDDSNAPHRRPITSNAQWKGEDVPDQDRSSVTACLCISDSLTDENVYSGSMNQCWGEILIHFHLKFPFKFSICGCWAGWLFEAAWRQVTLSLKMRFEGRKHSFCLIFSIVDASTFLIIIDYIDFFYWQ